MDNGAFEELSVRLALRDMSSRECSRGESESTGRLLFFGDK